MDYSKLTVTQLTAVSNVFMQIDTFIKDDLPPNFADMLSEYLQMDEIERMQLQSDMAVKANFKAYAQAIGNEGMADALEKVANDMAKMDTRSLNEIAKGGLSKMAEK